MTDKASQTKAAQPAHAPVVEEEQPYESPLAALLLLAPADLPNHPTAQPLRNRALLNHQARHGNQAVLRMLQRGPDPAPADPNVKTGLDASMIKVTVMKTPSGGGNVSVKKVGSGPDGYAQIESPKIEGEYGVTLDPSIKIGDKAEIKVGPVQTMTSSERVGIYKKDGKVVAEQRFSLGQTRDARPLSYDGKETFVAESPFYDKPQPLKDADPTASVHFIDRPSLRMPLEFGGGQLAGLRGADRFITSIGAKRDGTIITMNPFGWQVDWTTELGADFSVPTDANGNPISKGISTWEEKRGVAIDSPQVARDLLQHADAIFSFKSLDAALATPNSLLIVGLPAARRNDPDSANFMEQALKQKNPTFTIRIEAIKTATHNTWSADEDVLEVFANIVKQIPNKGPYTMKAGASQSVDVTLSELADASAINESAEMSVWLGGAKDVAILGEFVKFPFPFTGVQTLRLSKDQNGEYRVYLNIS
ncbi:MAG: hypothetical protein SH847_27485 [Roseiflexaceae bacterium]|nr:hypothetical protein [Roseiflexaceae bacterium]